MAVAGRLRSISILGRALSLPSPPSAVHTLQGVAKIVSRTKKKTDSTLLWHPTPPYPRVRFTGRTINHYCYTEKTWRH